MHQTAIDSLASPKHGLKDRPSALRWEVTEFFFFRLKLQLKNKSSPISKLYLCFPPQGKLAPKATISLFSTSRFFSTKPKIFRLTHERKPSWGYSLGNISFARKIQKTGTNRPFFHVQIQRKIIDQWQPQKCVRLSINMAEGKENCGRNINRCWSDSEAKKQWLCHLVRYDGVAYLTLQSDFQEVYTFVNC